MSLVAHFQKEPLIFVGCNLMNDIQGRFSVKTNEYYRK